MVEQQRRTIRQATQVNCCAVVAQHFIAEVALNRILTGEAELQRALFADGTAIQQRRPAIRLTLKVTHQVHRSLHPGSSY